jgi:enamine deaminase RidA (YjgF/YER057c/UK114 family)
MSIEARLANLGIELPRPSAPVAAYVPCVATLGLLHLSGQLPYRSDGTLIAGRLGENLTEEEGALAARACALMALAQAQAALGSLDCITRVVKLGVFVNSSSDFQKQSQVANGASNLMQEIFGESGRHARSAVGVSVLPLGAAVEVDAILEFQPKS